MGDAPDRAEPAGSTLVDLLALVAGVALAATLEWYSSWAAVRTLSRGVPAPGWYVATSYLGEGLRKGCLTLLSVVVARRARYGGAIRPAEFAALCVGVSRLLLSFERLPALGLIVPVPGRPGYYRVNFEAYRAWNLIQLAIAALAAWAVATRRRRLPAGIVGALVLVVWWGLSVPLQFFYQQGRNAISEVMPLPWTATRALDTLLTLPFGIVYLVPMAAAILDFRRPFRPGRTWVEWAGLMLAAASWIASEFRYLAMIYLDLPHSRFFVDASLHAAALLVEATAAVALVRRIGRLQQAR